MSAAGYGGAILGFCGGAFLTFVAPFLYPYPIQVSTQAFVPGAPTVVVLFELTMLGMLLSTFLGVFLDSLFPTTADGICEGSERRQDRHLLYLPG